MIDSLKYSICKLMFLFSRASQSSCWCFCKLLKLNIFFPNQWVSKFQTRFPNIMRNINQTCVYSQIFLFYSKAINQLNIKMHINKCSISFLTSITHFLLLLVYLIYPFNIHMLHEKILINMHLLLFSYSLYLTS
jgi:hypothetical protein